MLMHRKDFELELDADKTTTENLRGVKVEFRRPENGSFCSWTKRSKTAKVIFLNEVLRDRMANIDQADNPHKFQCIVFILAARIFPECAHLTLRWENILDSPSKFGFDVGDYMEATLFQGVCRVDIQQNTYAALKQSKRNEWTKEMPILDVVIKLRGLSVVRADHLNKFFTEKELCDKGLFLLDGETYQRTEGATVFLGVDCDRKRRREDPSMLIPPQCGISKRGSST
ncbi:hypothetical protein P3T76_001547 [Phytophthora citrophthora]|uniref:Uncharacterized protein n=1 Tax=Phytophthora citrophthora TaxID=4793 RepID=A0AAD9GZD3_9STRA|nr:hypothetical protein P3T76_001547 [Phytophthora citrophthora]